MAQSGKEHLRALKWIFRYLVGTIGVRIFYGQQDRAEELSNMSKEAMGQINGFMDANFGREMVTWWSTTGFMFSLFRGPVSWRSCLQPIMALSTTKAMMGASMISMRLDLQIG